MRSTRSKPLLAGGALWLTNRSGGNSIRRTSELHRLPDLQELTEPGITFHAIQASIAALRTRPWLASGWGCRGRRLSSERGKCIPVFFEPAGSCPTDL